MLDRIGQPPERRLTRTAAVAAPRRRLADRLTPSKLVVPIVVGTRPEAIKLVPIIQRMRESDHYEPLVVSTGQHHRMVGYIFELAGISPDVVLWAGSRRSQLNERVASVIHRFDDFCAERFELDPDTSPEPEDILNGRFPAAVFVHGDTTSAMAAALSAFHLQIPVMHVEAGLRTGGNNRTPFPEELNRQLISNIAGLHFAPTFKNLENLVRENVPVEQIFVSGNTGIDALQWAAAIDVRFANPAATGALRRRPPNRGRDRTSPRELGRRPRGSGRRCVGVSPKPSVESASSCRCTPTRASASALSRAARRHRERPAHRAARLRDVLQAAGALALRHHRLGRHPGGGAVAGQAGARRARDDRADRGPRCRHARLVGTDPELIFLEAQRLLDRPGRLRGDGRGAEPVRRRPARPSASSARSSTCCSAASRRTRSAPATTGPTVRARRRVRDRRAVRRVSRTRSDDDMEFRATVAA